MPVQIDRQPKLLTQSVSDGRNTFALRSVRRSCPWKSAHRCRRCKATHAIPSLGVMVGGAFVPAVAGTPMRRRATSRGSEPGGGKEEGGEHDNRRRPHEDRVSGREAESTCLMWLRLARWPGRPTPPRRRRPREKAVAPPNERTQEDGFPLLPDQLARMSEFEARSTGRRALVPKPPQTVRWSIYPQRSRAC
jgi:hypothetical protein